MKKIAVIAILTMFPAVSWGLDFGEVLKATRAGYAIDKNGEGYLTAYTPIKTYSPKGTDYVSINAGWVKKESDETLKAPCIQLGIRLDNILMLADKTEWGKANLKSATLPTFECGPVLFVIPTKNDNGKLVLIFKALLGVAIGF